MKYYYLVNISNKNSINNLPDLCLISTCNAKHACTLTGNSGSFIQLITPWKANAKFVSFSNFIIPNFKTISHAFKNNNNNYEFKYNNNNNDNDKCI